MISILSLLAVAKLGHGKEVDPVYAPFMTTPYDPKNCAGKPEGCEKVMQKLIEMEPKKGKAKPEKKNTPPPRVPVGQPMELNDSNFAEFVKGSEYSSMVLFYAPWCGHCTAMMPDYKKLAGVMKDKTVNIIKMDATENKKIPSKFKVQGFPTIVFFPKGDKPFTYKSGRDLDSFQQFLSPYAKDVPSDPVELKQLTSEVMFRNECNNKECLISVLPHLLDGGQAKGRTKAIADLDEAINNDPAFFKNRPAFWMEGGNNIAWEEALVGNTLNYPSTMVVNISKNEVATFEKSTLLARDLNNFFRKYNINKVPSNSFAKDLPKLKLTAWDGKDFKMDDEL